MATPKPATAEPRARCLACGETFTGPLAVLGSLRCVDCRSERRPLDAGLVASLARARPRRGRGGRATG